MTQFLMTALEDRKLSRSDAIEDKSVY